MWPLFLFFLLGVQIMMALSYEKLVEPPVVLHATDSESEG